MSDAANNVTSMSYDLLGRKTAMVDPEMGAWQYSYDGAGNLTAQKDGRNLWLYFEYDVLNRLVRKRQDSATGPIIAEYLFDATGQQGLLSRSTAYTAQGAVEVYNVTYDARNRLTQQNWIVPGAGGGTFRLDTAYNAADQQATLRYPGGTAGQQGELVTTGYNSVGQVNSVSGSGVSYVSSTTYNAGGQVTEQRLDSGANGLTRQYVYESNTLRLSTTRAGVASPYTNLQNLSYSYDNVGNVTSIVDGVNSNQRQCFQYDWLHRLTGAFSGNAGCTAYSATGNYPYNHSYGYNAIGNITSYAGASYTYGAGAPHAVSAAFGNTYGYDGNGNQTTRTIGGVTYTQVFDYENRLTEVKQGATSLATFLYDADGNRVKGAVSGTTTVYIAGLYEQQGAAYTSYYEGGGLRRSGYSTNNGVFCMLGDHLKSTSALVARNGVLNIKYFYYPYGARRGLAFNTITAKHFTGQYHETSLPGGEGLYIFSARWYDPKLARFVSADTIVPDPSVPQSLNRYAYAIGNPLRYTDPSGHMFCEDCTGGAGHYGGGGVGGGSSSSSGSRGHAGEDYDLVDRSVYRRFVTAATVSSRLPNPPRGYRWDPVFGLNGTTRIMITPYITVLESDEKYYDGNYVDIPGLEGIAPMIREGMLNDLYEEGSLKLKDGRFIQRDWLASHKQGRPAYMLVLPPPHAANGRVEAYKTAAANPALLGGNYPTDVFIIELGLRVTVNDIGGGLRPDGPLDVYVGEGIAAEKAFGVHFSEVYMLVSE